MSTIKNDPMLPVGDRPFWDQELSEEEGERIRSVADSFVLLKSLKQSRDRWLFHTLPKFSSKGRGSKASDAVTPPNNTIQNRGKCDLQIGPHLFPNTIFYEVHYLSSQLPSGPSQNSGSTSNPYWQSTMAHGSQHSLPAPASNATPSTTTVAPPSQAEIASSPLISSLTPAASITPSLINQVNVAASTNPILSNLLQLAAASRASESQLKTLGLLIQSLANMEYASAASSSNTPTQQQPSQSPWSTTNYYRLPTHPPVKEFDFVIEFTETPNDRWLIPRGSIYAKLLPNVMPSNPDIELTLCIPSNSPSMSAQPTGAGSNNIPVTLRLKEAPLTIWDTVVRWAGGEDKMKTSKDYLDSLVSPKRLYLGLHLPPGQLLTQLQAACAPSYAMKPLRQGPTAPRQKRNYTSRRTAAKTGDGSTDSIVVKKARTSQSKSSAPTPIQCLSCKKTDVPLILGGRFCRPCADSGQALVPLQVNPT